MPTMNADPDALPVGTTPPRDDDAIVISSVCKRFGSTTAVNDLNLRIPRGGLVGFLGPNGAGKSTTIRMIMSIIYPDSGDISVLGGSALGAKDRIGYLPEERGLYRKMRVTEFLYYIGRLKGLGGRDLKNRIAEWLERIDLPGVERKRCSELSKGMQQKVQFVASVIHDPDLIILDEPFSGLDPVNADLLNSIIKGLHDQGRTIIFSTHVLHQAEQICDRILLINHGQKILDATMDEIHERFDPHTLEVEPVGDPPDLASIDGVLQVARNDDASPIEVMLSDTADPQAAMQAILAAGPMRSVRLRRLSLEEVFVGLVRRDEGAEAAEAMREELRHD